MKINFKSKSFYTETSNDPHSAIGMIDINPQLNISWEKAIGILTHGPIDTSTVIFYYQDKKVKYVFTREEAIRINKLMRL